MIIKTVLFILLLLCLMKILYDLLSSVIIPGPLDVIIIKIPFIHLRSIFWGISQFFEERRHKFPRIMKNCPNCLFGDNKRGKKIDDYWYIYCISKQKYLKWDRHKNCFNQGKYPNWGKKKSIEEKFREFREHEFGKSDDEILNELFKLQNIDPEFETLFSQLIKATFGKDIEEIEKHLQICPKCGIHFYPNMPTTFCSNCMGVRNGGYVQFYIKPTKKNSTVRQSQCAHCGAVCIDAHLPCHKCGSFNYNLVKGDDETK